MTVACDIRDVPELTYEYQIVDDDEGNYQVWQSTEVLSGGYLNDQPFETFAEALTFLAEYIKEGEW